MMRQLPHWWWDGEDLAHPGVRKSRYFRVTLFIQILFRSRSLNGVIDQPHPIPITWRIRVDIELHTIPTAEARTVGH